jgi:hypothetical protein
MPRERQRIDAMAPAVVHPAVQATMTPAAGTGRGGVSIGQLILNIKGMIDFTDPLAARKFAAKLHAMLAQYERDYA